jgi:hypothetical protein
MCKQVESITVDNHEDWEYDDTPIESAFAEPPQEVDDHEDNVDADDLNENQPTNNDDQGVLIDAWDSDTLVVNNTVPHYRTQGPRDVIRTTPFTARMTNGQLWQFDRMYRYNLNLVDGVSFDEALKQIRWVMHSPLGWEKIGMRWVFTEDPDRANIYIQIVPQSKLRCGSGGCTFWSGGKRTAQVPTEFIGKDRFIRGPNHELAGHGLFDMEDMYESYSPPHENISAYYHGCMGNLYDSHNNARHTHLWPSDVEIDHARLWLQGKAPVVHGR